MLTQEVIFSFILIGVLGKSFVEGLQCYVCEDCNEYEDFKELHICGEIPFEMNTKPDETLLEVVESSASTTLKPIARPTTKPPTLPVNHNDYLDSEETHDEVSSLKETTKATTTTTRPTITTQSNTTKSTTLAAKPTTEKPTTLTTKSSTEQNATTITTQLSTSKVATTTKPKPVQLPDYDDYLEYEDPINAERRSDRSLLKMNEPVCYMIKYQVNNTVITNRGCTTFINDNKYLTCQSLYNGAPMESCRVCSSNGCNKFLSDDGDEDDHGIPLNAVGVLDRLGIVVLLLGVLINYFVIH